MTDRVPTIRSQPAGSTDHDMGRSFRHELVGVNRRSKSPFIANRSAPVGATDQNDDEGCRTGHATLLAVLNRGPRTVRAGLKRLTPSVRSAIRAEGIDRRRHRNPGVPDRDPQGPPRLPGNCPIDAYSKRIAAWTAISVRRRSSARSRHALPTPRTSPADSLHRHCAGAVSLKPSSGCCARHQCQTR